MALSPYPLISLALAREKQADIRRLILSGGKTQRGKAGFRSADPDSGPKGWNGLNPRP
jgi:hypothetical protein